jgi:hypothetical protein
MPGERASGPEQALKVRGLRVGGGSESQWGSSSRAAPLGSGRGVARRGSARLSAARGSVNRNRNILGGKIYILTNMIGHQNDTTELNSQPSLPSSSVGAYSTAPTSRQPNLPQSERDRERERERGSASSRPQRDPRFPSPHPARPPPHGPEPARFMPEIRHARMRQAGRQASELGPPYTALAHIIVLRGRAVLAGRLGYDPSYCNPLVSGSVNDCQKSIPSDSRNRSFWGLTASNLHTSITRV